MKILFLDDEKYRHDQFSQNAIGSTTIHCYSADEALAKLKSNQFDMVFLDHDLAPEHYHTSHPDDKNGQYICHKIMEYNLSIPFIVIHSLNPLGSAKMLEILGSRFRSRAIYMPMAWKFFGVTQQGWSFNYESVF